MVQLLVDDFFQRYSRLQHYHLHQFGTPLPPINLLIRAEICAVLCNVS